MFDQGELIRSLPRHLQPFARIQDYARYTPRDQAVWRYTLHQLERRLRDTAHPVYRQGLVQTGISLEHVPSMEEMNAALAPLGWRAVVVDGFIPPAIFMEFQALRVLVIAQDMRHVDHILYTPAPDIVHESAGHAPFIVDVDYAEYLQRFGELGMKAIATRQDMAVYEAIRKLSMIKEDPASTADDIARAEAELKLRQDENDQASEAARLARLHWWTVEYGLVGSLDDYRIFGAGLLSSLGESVNCLNDEKIHKHPLTVDVVAHPYDITREQPQLFVTRSCRHMSQVLEEFARSMCYLRGGAASLQTAIESGSVCTAEYSSGVQVSGQFGSLLCNAVGQPVYIGTTGPTQLAYRGRQIEGHGTDAHPEGFGAPVGQLKDMPHCLSEYSMDELREHGIDTGQWCELEFLSGVCVRGPLQRVVRQDHHNLIFSFEECSVTGPHGQTLFQPDWGRYDMTVGEQICSVFGGPADREHYQLYRHMVPPQTAASADASAPTDLMQLYQRLRTLREAGRPDPAALEEIRQQSEAFPQEWLLRLELLELAPQARSRILPELEVIARDRPHTSQLIAYGLQALEERD